MHFDNKEKNVTENLFRDLADSGLELKANIWQRHAWHLFAHGTRTLKGNI